MKKIQFILETIINFKDYINRQNEQILTHFKSSNTNTTLYMVTDLYSKNFYLDSELNDVQKDEFYDESDNEFDDCSSDEENMKSIYENSKFHLLNEIDHKKISNEDILIHDTNNVTEDKQIYEKMKNCIESTSQKESDDDYISVQKSNSGIPIFESENRKKLLDQKVKMNIVDHFKLNNSCIYFGEITIDDTSQKDSTKKLNENDYDLIRKYIENCSIEKIHERYRIHQINEDGENYNGASTSHKDSASSSIDFSMKSSINKFKTRLISLIDSIKLDEKTSQQSNDLFLREIKSELLKRKFKYVYNFISQRARKIPNRLKKRFKNTD